MAKHVEIDMEQLAALCRLKPTLADCAAFFGCSEDTIERRIKEHHGGTFAEFRDQKMVHTRFDLIRSAIKKAEKSDTMHIFCLKNLCKWKDKQAGEEDKIILNDYAKVSDIDLEERVKQLLEKDKAE